MITGAPDSSRRPARTRGGMVAWLALLCGAVAVPTQAQVAVPAPNGPAVGAQAQQNRLSSPAVLTLSLDGAGEQIDQQLDVTGQPTFVGSRQRAYSSGRARFDLRGNGRKATWQMGGDAFARAYSGQNIVTGETVTGSSGWQLGRHTQLRLTGLASYAPYYSLGGLFQAAGDSASAAFDGPGGAPLAAGTPIDTTLQRRSRINSAIDTGLSMGIGARSSFAVYGGGARTDFVEGADPSSSSWRGEALFTHNVAKSTRLRIGYARRETETRYPTGRNVAVVERIEVGVDFNKALSISRNTTVRFGSGTDVVRDDLGRRNFRVAATAMLDHPFGRTAHLTLQYSRRTEMIDGLIRPVSVESITPVLDVALGNIATWTTSAGYSGGTVGLDNTSANDYRAYYGTSGLAFPITRRAHLYVDYLYYHHDIGADVALIGPVSRTQQRQTLRAGVSLRLPLARDSQRSGS